MKQDINNLAEKVYVNIIIKIKDSFFKRGPYGKKNLNSSKIRKLGWKPQINLKSGLEKVIKYKLNKEL